jgi:hypothetical protein
MAMPPKKQLPTQYLGTYLYPNTFLAQPNFDDKLSATDVIDRLTISQTEVLVTRMGGLFTAIPHPLVGERRTPKGHLIWDHMQAQLDFEQSVCQTFNLLICEFCLRGHVSEPASPAFLGAATLEDNRIYVKRFHGAPVSYFDRALSPASALQHDDLFFLAALGKDLEIYPRARPLKTALLLSQLSPNLPTIVASAYSLYTQHRLSEALIDAWIAAEQIIDSIWESYLRLLPDKERIRRLKDERTYTVAVRLELLVTAGKLPEELYCALQKARHHRNAVAHRAEIGFFAAMDTLGALRLLIWHVSGEEPAQFPSPGGPMWDLETDEEDRS